MKTVSLGFAIFLAVASALARDKAAACRSIGIQCVNVVMKTDGSFWLADRVYENGRYTWLPIKRTDCPPAGRADYSVYVAIDPVYGAYRCIYPGHGEKGDSTPTIGTLGQKVGGYIRTHKRLLATDTMMTLASLAETSSRVHCQHSVRSCGPEYPFLPDRPTATEEYGTKLGFLSISIVCNHLWRREGGWKPKWGYEVLDVPFVAALGVETKYNVDWAEKYPTK